MAMKKIPPLKNGLTVKWFPDEKVYKLIAGNKNVILIDYFSNKNRFKTADAAISTGRNLKPTGLTYGSRYPKAWMRWFTIPTETIKGMEAVLQTLQAEIISLNKSKKKLKETGIAFDPKGQMKKYNRELTAHRTVVRMVRNSIKKLKS